MTYPTFRDGERSIDYVLVYRSSALLIQNRRQMFMYLKKSLDVLGLEFEEEKFSADKDVVFMKLHASDDLIATYAEVFDIDVACKNFEFRPIVKPSPFEFMATPLTRPSISDYVYARAPESISGVIPTRITSAERIMVLYELLSRVIWGRYRHEYSAFKLLEKKVLLDAFPLHDGDYVWTERGRLNDRQLLTRYWGRFAVWYKAQPLNLIEKYVGTQYALYFAWLGRYIEYLILGAVISIVVLIYGLTTFRTGLNQASHDICTSTIVMCPRCHFSNCPIEYLKNSCYLSNASYLFDNWLAVLFSAIMSIWSTIFMELWQREESILELQWNLVNIKRSIIMRPQYLEAAIRRKYCRYTDKMEPYIPKAETACRYLITLASLFILLLVMVAVTFGVMIYRVTVTLMMIRSSHLTVIDSKYQSMIASISGAIMSGLFILVFKWVYEKIALFLNNMEHHRSQHNFSNAYIYKSYALAFANNYAAVFYIAFFKGKFYTHPGDLKQFQWMGGINTHGCDHSGCIVDLAILLMIIMLIKAAGSNIMQILVPKVKSYFRRRIKGVVSTNIPQWEEEYLLEEAKEFFMIGEYMDMVIQYGFVNFFTMGFPLAPLLALINNTMELRVDANKVMTSYRRPVPEKVTGLGAWMAILNATTYIGVVTNAILLAFTSKFMDKFIWSLNANGSYLNSTLSIYDLKDFVILDGTIDAKLNISRYCYYEGRRYPPDHPRKPYKIKKEYWSNMVIKLSAVVIFEHTLVLIKGLVAYAIPDVPLSVRRQMINMEKMKKQKANIEESK